MGTGNMMLDSELQRKERKKRYEIRTFPPRICFQPALPSSKFQTTKKGRWGSDDPGLVTQRLTLVGGLNYRGIGRKKLKLGSPICI